MKKIAIIGKGTAGSLTYNHFAYYTNAHIDVYYDSKTIEQTVGEGTTLNIPEELNKTLGMEFKDLPKLNGNFKTSIYYEGFGANNYHHSFQMPNVSMHIDAALLQNYIAKKNKKRVKFIDKKINNHNDIDADYIIDCSGTPKDFKNYFKADYIPVNSAIVKQFYWEQPEFTYTLTKAMRNGWLFAIPLANRISLGYLYNNTLNNKKEIELEFNEYIKSINLKNEFKSINFTFKNYFKKINYTERVFYNGNASFFLEPMEATSLATVEEINRNIFDVIYNNKNIKSANQEHKDWFKEVQDVITMHYLVGSEYNTKFWKLSKSLAQSCLVRKSKRFENILNNYDNEKFNLDKTYGTWGLHNIKTNIDNLGIKELL